MRSQSLPLPHLWLAAAQHRRDPKILDRNRWRRGRPVSPFGRRWTVSTEEGHEESWKHTSPAARRRLKGRAWQSAILTSLISILALAVMSSEVGEISC
jgi:hypothetical protein